MGRMAGEGDCIVWWKGKWERKEGIRSVYKWPESMELQGRVAENRGKGSAKGKLLKNRFPLFHSCLCYASAYIYIHQ
uniref:Uncharacterized protein n=1 Tax=Cucumis melo TaxID=3656 RepID=A0A9I9EGI0_CUCME